MSFIFAKLQQASRCQLLLFLGFARENPPVTFVFSLTWSVLAPRGMQVGSKSLTLLSCPLAIRTRGDLGLEDLLAFPLRVRFRHNRPSETNSLFSHCSSLILPLPQDSARCSSCMGGSNSGTSLCHSDHCVSGEENLKQIFSPWQQAGLPLQIFTLDFQGGCHTISVKTG